MKKIITIILLCAACGGVSFGYADNESMLKAVSKRLEEIKAEADAKAEEANDYMFSPWRYDSAEYAKALRNEIFDLNIQATAKFYISSEYKAELQKNVQKKEIFQSANAFYSMVVSLYKLDDDQLIFYTLSLYDAGQMADPKKSDAYLAQSESRFKKFDTKVTFRKPYENEKLVEIMKRFKRINKVLKKRPLGGGDDFISLSAGLYNLFKTGIPKKLPF